MQVSASVNIYTINWFCFSCLKDLKKAKDSEHSAAEEQIKQKTEKIIALTQDLHTIKALQEATLRERSNLEVKIYP